MQATRRSILLGLGVASAPGLLRVSTAEASAADTAPQPQVVDWQGPHQAGIVESRPPHAIFVAFDLLAPDRAGLEHLLRDLTGRIAYHTGTGPVPQGSDALQPPPENGLIGAERVAQSLTITVSVGASLFADPRYGLEAQRPAELTAMEKFPNDAIDPHQAHGDLLVQICADSPEAAIYALRDIVRQTGTRMAPRWQVTGFLPVKPLTPAEGTGRNMMGFKDGTANPDTSDPAVMNRLVWVQPGAPGEPAWTAGGSYQVVRMIRNLVERWDRTQLASQEAIFGRHKLSGAPLGMARESDTPDFSSPAIPMNAHIRLANPRTAETARNVILRRGYNYANGLDKSGRMDMGLIFASYQNSIEAGFRTVQRRLDGEPLEEYVKPYGGGYFFALPGVARPDDLPDDFLGSGLLRAATL